MGWLSSAAVLWGMGTDAPVVCCSFLGVDGDSAVRADTRDLGQAGTVGCKHTLVCHVCA